MSTDFCSEGYLDYQRVRAMNPTALCVEYVRLKGEIRGLEFPNLYRFEGGQSAVQDFEEAMRVRADSDEHLATDVHALRERVVSTRKRILERR